MTREILARVSTEFKHTPTSIIVPFCLFASAFLSRSSMASKNSKPRAQTYNMLTDVQKNILKQHYDSGMVGTGRQYDEMITRAAEETGLPRNKVEVSLHWSFFP